MSVFKLPGTAIQANTITTTQLQTSVVTQIQAGGGPKVKSLIYPGNDTAANSTGGQTVYITGSGFAANAQVLVNGSAVPSQSFISASNISFTTPALSTGTYPVYIINPEDGGTAILYPGLLISGEPTWVTSAGSLSASQDELSSWSYSLSATGDTPITYALAAGNTLPTGINLAANGLISGTLSAPAGNTTTYTFSVIATDVQNQDSTRQFTVTTSTGEGVLFANNVLLIHADGTNNGNNHAFVDSSNNNLTITRSGNATQGSFSPFSQTGWSNYFDGNGDYLTTTSSTAFNLGSGDFTIEAWTYFNGTTDVNGDAILFIGDSTTNRPLSFYRAATNTFLLDLSTGGSNITQIQADGTIPSGVWMHFAATRSANTINIYFNGVLTKTQSYSSTLASYTGTVYIGRVPWNAPSGDFPGYISNLRVVKGTAVYTSNFTPPTTALTAIANTSLLTCQSNRLIDNSTNALTITRNGDVSIQAFSPFAPTAAYSTANVGGSVYLDGTGDYLTPANSTATDLGISRQPFTLEWWTYFTTTSGSQYLISKGGGFGGWNSTTGWQYVFSIEFSSSVFSLGYWNGSSYTYWQPSFSSVGVFGRWNHMVLSYDGTNLSAYVNGTRIGTTTVTNFTKPSSSDKCGIGSTVGVTGEAYYYNGYISGFRIVQGNVVYDPTSATLTVPTSPPTNVANTSLLLNFTNAQIFDQTAKNVLETVGDAKVSTAQYKYGTGSIAFDGTGDWLVSPVSQNFDFGTGDFTIECWFRLNSLASNYYVIGGNYNAGASDEWLFQVQNNGSIRFLTSADSTFATPSPAITTNTWYHLAATRSGSTVRLFIDGTSIRSYTNANSLGSASKKVYWGIQANESSWPFNGYIDDIRITKGYARYTSNFTPPTSALKDK